MKRIIACYFLLACFLLSACGTMGGNGVPSSNDTDLVSVNKYHILAEGINETENFFFGGQQGGHFLYYYDKLNGLSDFLCADPSCTHDSINCGAYTGQVGLVTFYEGKRYWIAGGTEDRTVDRTLWRGDLGGENREKVKKLSYESVGQYGSQQSVIYRGKLYIMGWANTIEGVKVGMRVTLLRTSIDSDETVEMLFDEAGTLAVRSRMLFVGDHVYFGITTWTQDGVYSAKILKINVDTLEQEVVYEETDIPEVVGNFWVTEDGKLYLPGINKFWRIENGERVVVSELSEGIGPARMDDGIVLQIYSIDGIRYSDIRDLDGNVLYQGRLFPNGVEGLPGDPNAVSEYYQGIYGGDPDKILVYVQPCSDSAEKSGQPVNNPAYFLMLDLKDNMKPTLLWTATK